ncbi:WG repeat-containing protein [Paenibacillus residui]|uniref:WG repeat-containing protein n=1 Tax=Paenibacillus residui TaxID=629724 RepID=A0ABW3D4B1_9BACL
MRRHVCSKLMCSIMGCAIILLGIANTGFAQSPVFVIPPQYDAAWPFSEGLAQIEQDGQHGFIDTTGQLAFPLPHEYTENYNDYTWNFSEGMAKILRAGKYGFIDNTGKDRIPPQYDDSADFFKEGLAAVSKGGKWGFIDKNGQEVVKLQYDEAGSFYEGRAWVRKNGKMGFIDTTGKEVIPIQYESVSHFSDGLASVTKNGQSFLIDLTGTEVHLGKSFDYVIGFDEGMGVVIKEENFDLKYGFIDKSGNVVVEPQYERVLGFKEGIARVQQNGVWGFIDKTGKEIVKPQYHNASDFSEGLARVSKNMKYGFIDKTGNEVIPLQYEFAGDFNDGLAPVQKRYKWGYIAHPAPESRLPSGSDSPDDWAADGISVAIEAGLIPPALQKDYRNKITRQEFSTLVIHFIEAQTGTGIDHFLLEKNVSMPEPPFTDTVDKDVLAAYTLGIVSGKGAGRFDPEGSLTREEAAVMLRNTANVLDLDTAAPPASFADNELIAGWAYDSVAYVVSRGIMNGVGNNEFDPKGSYTRQQAYLTILRLFDP